MPAAEFLNHKEQALAPVIELPVSAAPQLYNDYQLPDYTEIAGSPLITTGEGRQQDQYGVTHIDKVEMDDEAGTSYKVMRCLADNPQSNVWIVKDTAWSTQVTGLDTDVARKLMQIGFNVLIKGPEIGSSVPLSQSAWNTHAILDAYAERGDVEDDEIAVEGYSRGSMIAFGVNAYAKQFDRKLLYSNLTDPCVALPVKVAPMDLETAKKAVTLPLDIALLGLAAAKGLAHPTRGKDLLKTVDVSWEGAKQFYRTGKPLMNGESGMMAARTPGDMHATIAFFRNCRVNDKSVYQSILNDKTHPGVRFVEPAGGHGGGIDSRIIGNVTVRFGRLLEELRDKGSSDGIDHHYITHNSRAAA